MSLLSVVIYGFVASSGSYLVVHAWRQRSERHRRHRALMAWITEMERREGMR